MHAPLDRFLSHDRQVRHEPGVADGVEAFKRDLEMLIRDRTTDQSDLIFIVARGTHRGEPCAYVDLYRVAGAQLVEHWGFPQPIPPAEARKNRSAPL